MYRNSYLLIGAVLLGAATAQARTLTSDEARVEAASFLSTGAMRAPALTQGNGLQLKATLNSPSGEAALYVFTGATGQGFVISSAESETQQVLGFSDSGTFDSAKINPNFQYWLDCYKEQIQAVRDGNVRQVPMPRTAALGADIPKIVQSTWDQDTPYNNLCPDAVYGSGKCYTGCVATATAQAMGVYQYPAQGTGTVSYTWYYQTSYSQKNKGTLTQNLAHTLDWDNIKPDYSGSYTTAEATAIATLMRDVGYACHMAYGDSYNGGSGAMEWDAVRALTVNFKYNKGMYAAFKESYDQDYYNNLLYSELAAGHPIVYCGAGDEGGHCFILDGYKYQSSKNYYHFNWGWSGQNDGFYLLTALNPGSGGAGGGGYEFTQSQSAIVGIYPDEAGTTSYSYNMYNYEEDWGVSPTSGTTSSSFTFSGAFYNTSAVNITGKLGFKITDGSGNVSYAQGSTSFDLGSGDPFANSAGTQYATYSVSGSNIPVGAGTYTVTPAFYCNQDGQWHDVQTCASNKSAYTMTVTSSSIRFAQDSSWAGYSGTVVEPTPAGEVTVSAVSLAEGTTVYTPGYTNTYSTCTLDFTLSDTESETVSVAPIYYTAAGTEMARGAAANIQLTAGQTKTVNAQEFALSSGTLAAGAAKVGLLVNGQPNGPQADITIIDGHPSFTFTSTTQWDAANPSQLTINAEATCVRADGPNAYAGKLWAYAYPNATGKTPNMGKTSVNVTGFNAGETRTISFQINLSQSLTAGTTYTYKFGMTPTGYTTYSDIPFSTVYSFIPQATTPEPTDPVLSLSSVTATQLFSPSYKASFPVALNMTLTSDQALAAQIVPVFYAADGTEMARGTAQSAQLTASANSINYSQEIASGTLVAGEATVAIEVDGTEVGNRTDLTIADGTPYFTFTPQVADLTAEGFTVRGTAQCVRAIGPNAYNGKFHVYVYDADGQDCTGSDYVADASVAISDVAAGTSTTFAIPTTWKSGYTPVDEAEYYYVIWINEGTTVYKADPTIFTFTYEEGSEPTPDPEPTTELTIDDLDTSSLWSNNYYYTHNATLVFNVTSPTDATLSIVPVFYNVDDTEMARGTAQSETAVANTPLTVTYDQAIASGTMVPGAAKLALEINGTQIGDKHDVTILDGHTVMEYNPGVQYTGVSNYSIISNLHCVVPEGPNPYSGKIWVYIYQNEACASGTSIASKSKSISNLVADDDATLQFDFTKSLTSGNTYYYKFGFTDGNVIRMDQTKYSFVANSNPHFAYTTSADVDHATTEGIDITCDYRLAQNLNSTYTGGLYCYVYPAESCADGTSIWKSDRAEISDLNIGESGEIVFHATFEAAPSSSGIARTVTLEPNTTYYYRFRVLRSNGYHYWDGGTYSFTTSPNITGITGIEADEADAEYYNLQGFRVSPKNLAPGTVYIRRTAKGSTKVMR